MGIVLLFRSGVVGLTKERIKCGRYMGPAYVTMNLVIELRDTSALTTSNYTNRLNRTHLCSLLV